MYSIIYVIGMTLDLFFIIQRYCVYTVITNYLLSIIQICKQSGLGIEVEVKQTTGKNHGAPMMNVF